MPNASGQQGDHVPSVSRSTDGMCDQLTRALLLLLGIALLVLPTPSSALHIGKVLALLAILMINLRWGEPRAWYAFVLFLVVMVVTLVPALHVWNPLVVPATGFAIVAWVRPRWLAGHRWLSRGRLSRATLVLSAATIPLSAGALVAWACTAQPNLSTYADMIPGSGIGMVIGAAVVFALFNALAEEMVFRGVIWQALADTGLASVAVLLIQAVAFGVLHFGGVPSGLAGVGLASAYGLALGGIRLLSKGLLFPIVVHAFADLTIFLIIMRLAERW